MGHCGAVDSGTEDREKNKEKGIMFMVFGGGVVRKRGGKKLWYYKERVPLTFFPPHSSSPQFLPTVPPHSSSSYPRFLFFTIEHSPLSNVDPPPTK